MKLIKEWNQNSAGDFARAIEYIREDLANGDTLSWCLDHHSELFGIERAALAHECDLQGVK